MLLQFNTVRAPWIKVFRNATLPRLLIAPIRLMSPLACCFGVSPIQAAQKAGLKVIGLEKRIDIRSVGGSAIATGRKGQRDIDLVLETIGPNGQRVFVELKGWTETVTYITKTGEEVTVGAGRWFKDQLANPGSQIYKDIILFVTKREDLGIDAFQGVKWYLTPEAIKSLGGSQKMVDDVIGGVVSNGKWFKEHLGIKNGEDFYDLVDDLKAAMKKSGNEFFKAVE